MKKALLLFFFLIGCSPAFLLIAQDTIYFANGETEVAKVLEIGTVEISYKKFNYLDGPTFITTRSKLKSIHFSNGTKETFALETTQPAGEPEDYFTDILQDPRYKWPFGIGAKLGGPVAISMDFNYFVNHKVEFNLGVSPLGFYAGGNYHLISLAPDKAWSMYVGLNLSAAGLVEDMIGGGGPEFFGAYVPTGFRFIGTDQFTFSGEIAAYHIFNEGITVPFAGVKFGVQL